MITASSPKLRFSLSAVSSASSRMKVWPGGAVEMRSQRVYSYAELNRDGPEGGVVGGMLQGLFKGS